MGNLNATTIIILIVIVAVLTAVVIGIQALCNKATDNVRNRIIDSKAKKNPPKEEKLADRYKVDK